MLRARAWQARRTAESVGGDRGAGARESMGREGYGRRERSKRAGEKCEIILRNGNYFNSTMRYFR